MDKIIIALYVNTGNLQMHDVHKMLHAMDERLKPVNEENGILMYIFPTRDETRMECVYPKVVSDENLDDEIRGMVDRFKRMVMLASSPKKNFREVLRDQILIPQKPKGETDEDYDVRDTIDMYELNVEKWPKEDGEPLDMENWDVVSINDEEMVMIVGGDWQDGGVLRIGLNDFGDGLRVHEVVEYDEEKHGVRMSIEDFVKELMK